MVKMNNEPTVVTCLAVCVSVVVMSRLLVQSLREQQASTQHTVSASRLFCTVFQNWEHVDNMRLHNLLYVGDTRRYCYSAPTCSINHLRPVRDIPRSI